MFGLGIVELSAIVLVALILIRPKDLPRLFRTIGRAYRQITGEVADAKRILMDIGDDLQDGGIPGTPSEEPLDREENPH
jgi:sec-independent protein translocase protein TatB